MSGTFTASCSMPTELTSTPPIASTFSSCCSRGRRDTWQLSLSSVALWPPELASRFLHVSRTSTRAIPLTQYVPLTSFPCAHSRIANQPPALRRSPTWTQQSSLTTSRPPRSRWRCRAGCSTTVRHSCQRRRLLGSRARPAFTLPPASARPSSASRSLPDFRTEI